MSLVFTDGFDVGDVAIKWLKESNTTAISPGRHGTGRHIRITGASSDDATRAFAAQSKLFIGFAFRTSHILGQDVVALYGDAGLTTHHVLELNSSGLLRANRGATIIATGTTQLFPNVWYYIEIEATVSDVSGVFNVRLNGATSNEISFTGDTKNGGTATTLDKVGLQSPSGSAARLADFDDLYIANDSGSLNNTWLGDTRIQTLRPNGAGATTQLTPTGSANNWENVDDDPYNTATYNSSATVGQRDTYTLTDLIASTVTVKGVVNNLIAGSTDATPTNLKGVVRSAGTNYDDSTYPLAAAPLTYQTPRDVDPATSAAWTVAAVNALEAGAEVV